MMAVNKLQINFFAGLRQVVGQKSIELDLPAPCSIGNLIEIILNAYPQLEGAMVNEQGELHTHLNILVNGRDVRYLEDQFNTLLADGDQVSIFPALGGGCEGIIYFI